MRQVVSGVLAVLVIALVLLFITTFIVASAKAVNDSYARMAAANGKYCLILADVVQLDQCVTITPNGK